MPWFSCLPTWWVALLLARLLMQHAMQCNGEIGSEGKEGHSFVRPVVESESNGHFSWFDMDGAHAPFFIEGLSLEVRDPHPSLSLPERKELMSTPAAFFLVLAVRLTAFHPCYVQVLDEMYTRTPHLRIWSASCDMCTGWRPARTQDSQESECVCFPAFSS